MNLPLSGSNLPLPLPDCVAEAEAIREDADVGYACIECGTIEECYRCSGCGEPICEHCAAYVETERWDAECRECFGS